MTPPRRWSLFSKLTIKDRKDHTDTYLIRWRLIQTPWFGIYLHRIFRPDNDRHPHDHPWGFRSVVLKGGYVQEIFSLSRMAINGSHRVNLSIPKVQVQKLFSTYRMTTWKAHRILSVRPGTITLVIVGRKIKEWGFWTENGWVHERDYVQAGEVE